VERRRYDVLADATVIDRIFNSMKAPVGDPQVRITEAGRLLALLLTSRLDFPCDTQRVARPGRGQGPTRAQSVAPRASVVTRLLEPGHPHTSCLGGHSYAASKSAQNPATVRKMKDSDVKDDVRR
jgi:hypothetical protein